MPLREGDVKSGKTIDDDGAADWWARGLAAFSLVWGPAVSYLIWRRSKGKLLVKVVYFPPDPSGYDFFRLELANEGGQQVVVHELRLELENAIANEGKNPVKVYPPKGEDRPDRIVALAASCPIPATITPTDRQWFRLSAHGVRGHFLLPQVNVPQPEPRRIVAVGVLGHYREVRSEPFDVSLE